MAEKEAYEITNAVDDKIFRPQSLDAHLATLLTQTFRTRRDLYAAIKWSSSLQGCRAVTEKKHSGGGAIIVTCCSRDKAIGGDNVVRCTMRVVARKSRSRKKPTVWTLSEGTKVSNLKHIPGCQSINKVSQTELMASKVFVDTILSNKFTSTKTIIEILTGVGMPFHGMSIPAQTIYRVRRRICASDPEYNRIQVKRFQRRNRSILETIPSNILLYISPFLMAVALSRLLCVSRSLQIFEKKDAESLWFERLQDVLDRRISREGPCVIGDQSLWGKFRFKNALRLVSSIDLSGTWTVDGRFCHPMTDTYSYTMLVRQHAAKKGQVMFRAISGNVYAYNQLPFRMSCTGSLLGDSLLLIQQFGDGLCNFAHAKVSLDGDYMSGHWTQKQIPDSRQGELVMGKFSARRTHRLPLLGDRATAASAPEDGGGATTTTTTTTTMRSVDHDVHI